MLCSSGWMSNQRRVVGPRSVGGSSQWRRPPRTPRWRLCGRERSRRLRGDGEHCHHLRETVLVSNVPFPEGPGAMAPAGRARRAWRRFGLRPEPQVFTDVWRLTFTERHRRPRVSAASGRRARREERALVGEAACPCPSVPARVRRQLRQQNGQQEGGGARRFTPPCPT